MLHASNYNNDPWPPMCGRDADRDDIVRFQRFQLNGWRETRWTRERLCWECASILGFEPLPDLKE